MADVIIVTKSTYFHAKRVNHIVFYEEEANGNNYGMPDYSIFGNLSKPAKPRPARVVGKKSKKMSAAQKARLAKQKKAAAEKPPEPKMLYIIDMNYNDAIDQMQGTRVFFNSKKKAMECYKEIIIQIRDQHPDKPLVDRLANEYLLGIKDDEK